MKKYYNGPDWRHDIPTWESEPEITLQKIHVEKRIHDEDHDAIGCICCCWDCRDDWRFRRVSKAERKQYEEQEKGERRDMMKATIVGFTEKGKYRDELLDLIKELYSKEELEGSVDQERAHRGNNEGW